MSDSYRNPARPHHAQPLNFVPAAADVAALIAAAKRHPLGIEYLREGALDSVAITLKTHAFTVIAAREFLSRTES